MFFVYSDNRIALYGIEYWIGLLHYRATENNMTVLKMWWSDGTTAKYLNNDAKEGVDINCYFYLDETGLWLTSYPNQYRPFICKMAASEYNAIVAYMYVYVYVCMYVTYRHMSCVHEYMHT